MRRELLERVEPARFHTKRMADRFGPCLLGSVTRLALAAVTVRAEEGAEGER